MKLKLEGLEGPTSEWNNGTPGASAAYLEPQL